MVGRAPQSGSTTHVDTSLIPLSFYFDEFVDQNGNNIVLDVGPDVQPIETSPNWEPFSYGTGNTQFGDAVQRAEFWSVQGPAWHTLLEQPRMLKPVVVEVPVGAAQLYQTQQGKLFSVMDERFFISQLNTIIQLEDLRVNELSLLVSTGVGLYENGDPNQCCVLGFHTAFETQVIGDTHYVQTLAWASWFDPGIFSSNSLGDVTGLSHEISEWMNDPFISNATPPWEFPGYPNACQANLETGDPVEVLQNTTFPVTLHGFTYHPQTEALLQWFTRENPSHAFQGAYSYPDTNALTSPSVACGQ
jgi:hypothetical protein